MANSDFTNGDFAGLTATQVKTVLSTIATHANTMRQICSAHADVHDLENLGNVFRALEMMLSNIGALADRPLGGDCIGDVASWHCGPNYRHA